VGRLGARAVGEQQEKMHSRLQPQLLVLRESLLEGVCMDHPPVLLRKVREVLLGAGDSALQRQVLAETKGHAQESAVEV
jgi:hypothetical protein